MVLGPEAHPANKVAANNSSVFLLNNIIIFPFT